MPAFVEAEFLVVLTAPAAGLGGKLPSVWEAYGEPSAGSITTSAPHCAASARRPPEKSLAITVRTPLAFSMQITERPMGPQPMTIATVRFLTSPRRTACQPTAIGSVSAASSGESPLGTATASDSCTSSCSA